MRKHICSVAVTVTVFAPSPVGQSPRESATPGPAAAVQVEARSGSEPHRKRRTHPACGAAEL